MIDKLKAGGRWIVGMALEPSTHASLAAICLASAPYKPGFASGAFVFGFFGMILREKGKQPQPAGDGQ